MKQVIQSYKTGKVDLADVPAPKAGGNRVLVRTSRSLISIGTERSVIDLGRKSLLGKARARPDLVKRALEKARNEGFYKTFQEAMGRLDTPTPLGYSSAGTILECGKEATEFAPGDRIACVGQGFASHAEFVSIPSNLACRIPENVSDDAASFGMLGIIALHGVRNAKISFGSSVAVVGLGLLGLLTVQILKAYGCRVVAMDIDPDKAEQALGLGADTAVSNSADMKNAVSGMTDDFGVDAVIITAATKSDAPINQAVDISRFGGRVVLVGVADIHPDRNEMWLKEVEIVVSKAAGPGSLDPVYEFDGVDLPIGHVRWTQKRNLEEFLRLMSVGLVTIEPLISHRFGIAAAVDAYTGIISGSLEKPIGVLLEYDDDAPLDRVVRIKESKAGKSDKAVLGVVGAGLFGKALMLPALTKRSDVRFKTLVTSSGASAWHSGKKFDFEVSATDDAAIFEDDEINAVVGLVPHSRHADLVLRSIETGRHLFVEKPLCVTPEELDKIRAQADATTTTPVIMVGHNRRFSPHTVKICSWLKNRQAPAVISYRVNAGFVPADHWVHSDKEGRSRIVGEMSHFLDLMETIIGQPINRVSAERIGGDGHNVINNDNVVVTLKFADGSVGTLLYSAQGNRSVPREQMDIYTEGVSIQMTDYRISEMFDGGKGNKFKTTGQSMGYEEELAHFIAAVRGDAVPSPTLQQSITTMSTIFAIETSLATGTSVTV